MSVEKSVAALFDPAHTLSQKVDILDALKVAVYESSDILYTIIQRLIQKVPPIAHPVPALSIASTSYGMAYDLHYPTLTALLCPVLGSQHVTQLLNQPYDDQRYTVYDLLDDLNQNYLLPHEKANDKMKQQTACFAQLSQWCPLLFELLDNLHQSADYQAQYRFLRQLLLLIEVMPAPKRLVGVSDKALLPVYANALIKMGVTHALVVYGGKGVDLFSVCGVNEVIQIQNACQKSFSLHPEQLGFMRSKPQYLKMASDQGALEQIQMLLKNELLGPKHDMLCLNIAAGYYVDQDFTISVADALEQTQAAFYNGTFYRHLFE